MKLTDEEIKRSELQQDAWYQGWCDGRMNKESKPNYGSENNLIGFYRSGYKDGKHARKNITTCLIENLPAYYSEQELSIQRIYPRNSGPQS